MSVVRVEGVGRAHTGTAVDVIDGEMIGTVGEGAESRIVCTGTSMLSGAGLIEESGINSILDSASGLSTEREGRGRGRGTADTCSTTVKGNDSG